MYENGELSHTTVLQPRNYYEYELSNNEFSEKNLWMAGDWIQCRTRSWFLERSAVTGIEAANAILLRQGLPPWTILAKDKPHWLVSLFALPYGFWNGLKKGLSRAIFGGEP